MTEITRVQQEEEKKRREEEDKKKAAKDRMKKSIVKEFKNPTVVDRVPGADKEVLNQLAKHKDPHKKKRELLKLQQQFPHDRVVQKMVEQEFKENRVFRYPEEYEVFNLEEQKAIKLKAKWQTTGPVDYDKLKEVGDKKRDTFNAEERS